MRVIRALYRSAESGQPVALEPFAKRARPSLEQEIRRPPHAASGSATVLFDQGRGKATVNVIYNGKMTDTIFSFPQQSTTTLNAYTLVGGMISYDTTPWSTIYVRGENVFNQIYEEVYSYRSPGAAVYAGIKVRTN